MLTPCQSCRIISGWQAHVGNWIVTSCQPHRVTSGWQTHDTNWIVTSCQPCRIISGWQVYVSNWIVTSCQPCRVTCGRRTHVNVSLYRRLSWKGHHCGWINLTCLFFILCRSLPFWKLHEACTWWANCTEQSACSADSFTVSPQFPCAITYINICEHVKNPTHWQPYIPLFGRTKYSTHW